MILGRVEHLEQRGGRIPSPVRADLVDLVEHEHGVARLGPPEALDDAAGHRADVGPAVAADLGLVTHAAERHADEAPAEGASDALAEAGLADAGGPDEAEDRLPRGTVARHVRRLGRHRRPGGTGLARPSVALLPELLDGQVLKDPVLDLLEVVVVLVQDLAGPADVDGPTAQLAPRQARHRFEIRDDHAVLR